MNCISKSDVLKYNNFIILDVRTNEEREIKYIPNSIHIPINELENRIKELSNKNFYITACGKGGGRSILGAEILRKSNFEASWLCNGTIGWLEK